MCARVSGLPSTISAMEKCSSKQGHCSADSSFLLYLKEEKEFSVLAIKMYQVALNPIFFFFPAGTNMANEGLSGWFSRTLRKPLLYWNSSHQHGTSLWFLGASLMPYELLEVIFGQTSDSDVPLGPGLSRKGH